MKIKVGDKLIPTTIENEVWIVLAVVNNAVCVQSESYRADKYGHIQEVSWFNKQELENSENIKKL